MPPNRKLGLGSLDGGRPPIPPGAAAALALAAGVAAVAPAHGDTLDPSIPRVVVVGAPRGPAPSERLDPRRTGRARTVLPASPKEIWHRHVSGSLDQPPLVDPAGNILVTLTIPEIVALGPDARELWRARLGPLPAIAPPTLLADGTIAVVTAAGIAWGFSPSGAVRFATVLGVPRRDADTAPLALSTGGLLVAAGNAIVELDVDGSVRARASLDEHAAERAAGAVIEGPGGDGGVLVTTLGGSVFRFRPPAAPHRIGSFGGITTRGAVLADERTLLAVVDGRRLVALDLPTGVTHVRTGGIALDGPPTLAPALEAGPDGGSALRDDGGSAPKPPAAGAPPLTAVPQGKDPAAPPAHGVALVATQLGMLLGVDAAGNERAHVLLEKPPPSSAMSFMLPGAIVQPDLKPSPPVVVDENGRVAFVRASGRAGVVSPEGRVEVANERVCAQPIAVVPAGDKRMLVACHDGALWMYGE